MGDRISDLTKIIGANISGRETTAFVQEGDTMSMDINAITHHLKKITR